MFDKIKTSTLSNRVRSAILFFSLLIIAFSAAQIMAQVENADSRNTPPTAQSLIEEGSAQLRKARAEKSIEGFQLAEDLFARAITLEAKNAAALLNLGLAQLEHSGLLAQKGDFTASGALLQKAIAALDAAVAAAPEDFNVRLSRGLSYEQFPAFLNKGETAREDLLQAVQNTAFERQKDVIKARARLALGRLYVLQGLPEKARGQFRAVVQISQTSAEGKSAAAELEKLAAPPQAVNPSGQPVPDRFPNVSADASPIIVSASVTFPNRKEPFNPNALPASMNALLYQIKMQPEMIGLHLLTSLDHPGMLVVLTWWENKKALNNWFYSTAHQNIIQSFYGKGTSAASTQPQMSEGSQVGIELFAPLPGGAIFGGGLAPSSVKKKKP